MKTNLFFVLAAMAASVLANPTVDTDNNLIARKDICHKASSCSSFWSGKCEEYCAPYKFSHMSGDDCGGFTEKCCCEA